MTNQIIIKPETDDVSAKAHEVILYQAKDGKISVEVSFNRETAWLNLNQMAVLFGRDKSVISRHLHNIFKTKELDRDSVVAKFATTALDKKTYQVDYYNLDAIISVGYRVNSKRGSQFRIWATSILRQYLINGYALNEKRLRDQALRLQALQRAVKLVGGMKDRKELDRREALGLLEVINDYNYALTLLDDYDFKRLKVSGTSKKEKYVLRYEAALNLLKELRDKFGSSHLFGKEKDRSFKGSVSAIYQTFDSKALYPSIEEKAANLLYFIVKNHSFIDGNKRIAVSIFLWFLEKNELLYRADGAKRIADNALVALTLLIAESDPAERETIVTLVVNLINKNN